MFNSTFPRGTSTFDRYGCTNHDSTSRHPIGHPIEAARADLVRIHILRNSNPQFLQIRKRNSHVSRKHLAWSHSDTVPSRRQGWQLTFCFLACRNHKYIWFDLSLALMLGSSGLGALAIVCRAVSSTTSKDAKRAMASSGCLSWVRHHDSSAGSDIGIGIFKACPRLFVV